MFSADGIKARTELLGSGLSSKQRENILRTDPNLIILKGLLSCLGKTYKEAYGRDVRRHMKCPYSGLGSARVCSPVLVDIKRQLCGIASVDVRLSLV